MYAYYTDSVGYCVDNNRFKSQILNVYIFHTAYDMFRINTYENVSSSIPDLVLLEGRHVIHIRPLHLN